MSQGSFSSFERRRFIRIVESCPLTFVTPKGESGEGNLLDLSLRGMRFSSDSLLSVDEKIRSEQGQHEVGESGGYEDHEEH